MSATDLRGAAGGPGADVPDRPVSPVDAGRAVSAVRTVRVGPVSARVPVRAAVVVLVGLVVTVVLAALDLSLGEFVVPVPDILATLGGGGTDDARYIILELRLPQTTVALVTGAALGLSGALTQTFARNALASPDILGVTQGASVGAVAFIVLVGGNATTVTPLLQRVGQPAAALVGGLLAATVLYVVSWRRGIEGQRLVLIGIGLSAFLLALTSWLLVTARIEDAASANVWLNGSLTGRGWDQALPLAVTLGVLVPLTLALVGSLNLLPLGDDSARGLGLHLQRSQLLVLICAVVLAAMAVAAAGPLTFVAFVVPQIALRLTRGSRPPLFASMVFGAALVVFADLTARVLLPFPLPAGVITAALGSPYLIWLLISTNRKVSA